MITGNWPSFPARVGKAIKWAILGKSDPSYLAELTGGEAYWDRVIAAQRGWPGERPVVAASGPTVDIVAEASVESFPASDAPAWTPISGTGSPRRSREVAA